MTRDELITCVKLSNADTLIAARMRETLGLPALAKAGKRGRVHDRGAKSRKYRGVKKLMKQRYGVRL